MPQAGRITSKEKSKMEVIVLEGPNNTGKTNTLSLLYARLVTASTKPATRIINAPAWVGPYAAMEDFDAMVGYTGVKGRRKIAIYSAGDLLKFIKAAVAKYAPLADVLVIPYDPRLKTPITTLIPPPHIITHTVSKTVTALHSKPLTTGFLLDCIVLNTIDAQTIEALL
jgi:hypothetical protein